MATRVSAVDGSALNIDQIPRNIITEKGISDAKHNSGQFGISLTPGGIGCALSHRAVWQRIVDENLDHVLILEDDIRINDDFYEKIDKITKAYQRGMHCVKTKSRESDGTSTFEEEPDMIFLGYHPSSYKSLHHHLFVASDRVYGLFAYVVTKKGAEKLLKLFPISEQIDTAISDAMTAKKLTVYLVRDEIRAITSDPSENATEFGTDIQIKKVATPNTSSKIENFDKCDYMDISYSRIIVLFIALLIILVYYLCE
jgi:GR25 family glycosyltransferase involved in LPS biosynthesis